MPAEAAVIGGMVKVIAGGAAGGIVALIIKQPSGIKEGVERLFCSVFATLMFGPMCCHGLRSYFTIPPGVDIELAVFGSLGSIGWFGLHWPINWAAARKDKTPFEIAAELVAKTGSLASKIGKEKT
jgi:hypothetical protein